VQGVSETTSSKMDGGHGASRIACKMNKGQNGNVTGAVVSKRHNGGEIWH